MRSMRGSPLPRSGGSGFSRRGGGGDALAPHARAAPACRRLAAAAVWQQQQEQPRQQQQGRRARRCVQVTAAAPGATPSSSSGAAAAAGAGASAGGRSHQRPIEVSRALAAARARESARPDSLFSDPFAVLLAEGSEAQEGDEEAALDVVATRYIDECLMNAIQGVNVNSINEGEYRQVVLVGDGFDTRPFRLPWPTGTVLFVVAPAEAHERAEALLANWEGGAPRVDRGCLLRRVDLNLGAAAAAAAAPAPAAAASAPASEPAPGASAQPPPPPAAPGAAGMVLLSQLERAGFRQDRLSLWAVQGLRGQGLPAPALLELLADVTNSAAFHSLVVGELPLEGPRSGVDNALADVGLLGAAYGHGDSLVGGGHGRLPDSLCEAGGGAGGAVESGAAAGAGSDEVRRRWLFASQQMRMSLGQMGIYEDHVQAAEDADEDFFGHFS